MGQGESKQEQEFIKKLDSQYDFLNNLNDARYGDGKLYVKKNNKNEMIVLKNINVPEEQSFQGWKNKIQQRQQLKHPNIIELKETILSEQEQVCSTHFKVNLVLEYCPITIRDAIQQRKQQGAYYAQQEITQMLKDSIEGLAKFQELKIPHQNLRSQTLSYLNGRVKVNDIPLLANITSFAAVLQDYGDAQQGNYLSPILTKAVYENNHMPNHNLYKSDVYTLGMIFLEICLLQPMDQCYEYYEGKINMQQLINNLDKCRNVYTSELMDILDEMLDQNENDRPDFITLKKKLAQQVQIQPQQEANEEQQYQFMFYNSNNHQEVNQENNFQDQSIEKSFLHDSPNELIDDKIDEIHEFIEPQPSIPNDYDTLVHNADLTRNSISPLKQNNSISQKQQQEIIVQPISFAQQQQNQPANFSIQQTNQSQQSFKNQLPQQIVINEKQDAFTQSSNIFSQKQVNTTYTKTTNIQPYVTQYQRDSTNVNDYIEKFHFSTPMDLKQYEINSHFDYDLLSKQQNQSQQQQRESYQSYQYQPQTRFVQSITTQQIPQNYQTTSNGQSQYVNEVAQNGQRYVGEKINGKKNGRGRLYYKEGGYYDGNWKDDKINGQGVLYYASGRPAYDGDWVEDKFQGKGVLYNDSPKFEDVDYRNLEDIGNGWTKYVGEFLDDNKSGSGILYFLNGDRFEGNFNQDQAQGPGQYISISGKVVKGNWQFNLFVG